MTLCTWRWKSGKVSLMLFLVLFLLLFHDIYSRHNSFIAWFYCVFWIFISPGVYQTCSVSGRYLSYNPCNGLTQVNPLTKGYYCPSDYKSVLLHNGVKLGHRESSRKCRRLACAWMTFRVYPYLHKFYHLGHLHICNGSAFAVDVLVVIVVRLFIAFFVAIL